MNLLTRLGMAYDSFRETFREARSYSTDLNNGTGYFGAFTNTSGESISKDRALRISTWFACLQVRWDSVATLPFNVYKTTGDSKEVAWDHPAYVLLHTRPNPTMTATQFWKIVQQRRDNYGNCFCVIDRVAGKPVSIRPIHNDCVKVYSNKETGELYYYVDDELVASSDIMHFKGFTTDGRMGLSLTEYHAETLGRLRSIQKFSNRSMRNPGTYVTSANQMPMNPTQADALKAHLKKEMQSYGDSGETPLLYNGFEFKTSGINPKDALYLEQINATKEDIYAITKVPPKLVQHYQNSMTYNNADGQGLDFLTWCLAINLKDIEDECNYKLFSEDERKTYFCKFNEGALLRLDAKSQAEVMEKLFKIGLYSINEMRSIKDLNPIADGDDHYIELNNLAPVRMQDEILEARAGMAPDAETPPEDQAEDPPEEKPTRKLNGYHDQRQLN